MKRSSARSVWLPLSVMVATVGIMFVLDLFARGWLSPLWYVLAAAIGLFVGGPVALWLRPKDYDGERPIREGMPGVWF